MNFKVVILSFLIVFNFFGKGSIVYNSAVAFGEEIEDVLSFEKEYVYSETKVATRTSIPKHSAYLFSQIVFSPSVTSFQEVSVSFYPSRLFILYHKLVI